MAVIHYEVFLTQFIQTDLLGHNGLINRPLRRKQQRPQHPQQHPQQVRTRQRLFRTTRRTQHRGQNATQYNTQKKKKSTHTTNTNTTPRHNKGSWGGAARQPETKRQERHCTQAKYTRHGHTYREEIERGRHIQREKKITTLTFTEVQRYTGYRETTRERRKRKN